MLIYKNLPQRNYLLFSDNALHFISAELIIRKHCSPGPQSMPLQCYPPSKSMRWCCSLEFYLTHHGKLWRRGPGTLCSWWMLCSAVWWMAAPCSVAYPRQWHSATASTCPGTALPGTAGLAQLDGSHSWCGRQRGRQQDWSTLTCERQS